MAVTATPIYPQAINAQVQTYVNADGTSYKTVYTAGSNGSRLTNILLTNTDSGSAYVVQLAVQISSTNYLIGTVNVPLSSGNTTSAPTVLALNSSQFAGLARDANGNPYIDLPAGVSAKLMALVTVAVTSAKTVTITASGVDF
jgi:hypothetical protein